MSNTNTEHRHSGIYRYGQWSCCGSYHWDDICWKAYGGHWGDFMASSAANTIGTALITWVCLGLPLFDKEMRNDLISGGHYECCNQHMKSTCKR